MVGVVDRSSALTWDQVDPAGWPFGRAGAEDVIRGLPAARRVPVRSFRPALTGPGRDRERAWRQDEAYPWVEEMSLQLTDRFGGWAGGWNSPIGSWCCVAHSIQGPDETLRTVIGSLLDWRDWLEHLAGRFERLLPLDEDAERPEVLRRVADGLVAAVTDRTAAGGWHRHGGQVFGWFLAAAGAPYERRPELIGAAVRVR